MEVARHPSAFGAELMNEPMTIKRDAAFQTWRASVEAINAIIPDMSVALADTGQVAQSPWNWLGGSFDIFSWTLAWIKESNTTFCKCDAKLAAHLMLASWVSSLTLCALHRVFVAR